MPVLQPDRNALCALLDGLFRYASDGVYVSLRAFRDDVDGPPLFVEPVRIDDPTLLERVVARASEAANGSVPYCFCPPVATFCTANGAKLTDLAEGLALSVECDANPEAARGKLIAVLGKPTLTVASGGEWHNPASGRAERKLHLHWRLSAPAYSPGQHELLREARELATKLAGADPSNITIVHPLRWPGSWHRKDPAKPRIAHIVDATGNEIELGDAVGLLRAACPQPERAPLRNSSAPSHAVPFEDIVAALAVIPGTDDRAEWIRVGEATYAASNGGAFDAWDAWSRKAPSKYGGTEKAWASFAKSPPRSIGFGTLVKLARDVDPSWRPPSWGAAPHPFSEDGIAEALAAREAERMRFVPARGHWLVWNGVAWRTDDKLSAFTGARVVCREAAKRTTKEAGQARLTSARTVAGVVMLARSDPRLVTSVEQWDADLWELTAANPDGGGVTIDLRTGDARAPRPEDHNTRCGNAALLPPDAPCPLWMAFLQRVTGGDAALIEFLCRWCGYCLTGDTREQKLLFLYGTGANGKSTFANVVSAIMGDYATTTPMETLLASKYSSERHTTDLAGLMGVRLVTAHEVAGGRRWDEDKIKWLTGGDKIKARFMRQDFFEYTPRFKLVVFGNHKPALRSVDEAIRRRLLLVPFTVTIPAAERDANLLDKLRGEHGAILRWMVSGCLAWQRDGLQIPASVCSATEDYFAAQNTFGEWITEALVEVPGAWTRTLDLFEVWKAWCEPRGLPHGSVKSFSEALEESGYVKQRDPGKQRRAGFLGVKLQG